MGSVVKMYGYYLVQFISRSLILQGTAYMNRISIITKVKRKLVMSDSLQRNRLYSP